MGEVTGGPQPRAPEALSDAHDLSQFRCAEHPDLADWLQQRARANEGRASRTYVLPLGNRAIGYYCIAAGAVARTVGNAKLRQNMPEQIPVLVIGRLAIDDEFRDYKLGRALLKDAVLRCLQAGKTVGVRAILVHAKDEKSAGFYRKYKFIESPTHPLTFFLPIETVEQVFR